MKSVSACHCLALTLLLSGGAAAATPLAPDALLAEARELLLDDQGSAAVARYERVLAAPEPEWHPEALEYLGVAEQLRGDPDAAIACFEDYLDRFPGSAGATRVAQRLAALTATPPSSPPLRRHRRWGAHGDFAQELWYDGFDNDQADDAVTRSYLLSHGSFGFDRRGARYDVSGRVDAAYQRALEEHGPGSDDQAQLANAYLQLMDGQQAWSLRLGRQTSGAHGLAGRFDGAAFSLALRPRLRLRGDTGLLVDTTRHWADERRGFAAVSLELEELAELVDLTVFAALQRNDGFADREAVGAEARLRRGAFALTGVIDYDVSYQTLNLAQVALSTSLTERLKVHGRLSAYAAPTLTTTNALIGQPSASLSELEETYREAQLRTLARHRSSDVLSFATGLRATLSQRWHLNADATLTRFDGTVASAGVARIPESRQSYLSADLIGTSILRRRDSVLVGYRFDRSEAADTHTLRLDLRLPFGRALHVAPTLSTSWRELYRHGDSELVLEPGMRLVYRPGQRMSFELEGRSRYSKREAPSEPSGPLSLLEDEQLSEYLLKASWRIDL